MYQGVSRACSTPENPSHYLLGQYLRETIRKLFGSQIQRLTITRVILKDSRIVLLDEATSSVDPNTEGLIQRALNSLCKGRTTFIIAYVFLFQ